MKVCLVFFSLIFIVGCNPSSGKSADVNPDPWEIAQVDGPKCANGTDVNMAISRAASQVESPTDKLVLYLQGGGACWDGVTCDSDTATAVYLDTRITDYLLKLDATESSQYGFGDRNDINNPFRNDNFAYIPYCTGDVHSGSLTQASTITTKLHRGGTNLLEFIGNPNGLLDQFPEVDEVFLVGASAGGFGAIAMYQQVAQAFSPVPVHLLTDGGIPLSAIHEPAIDPKTVAQADTPRSMAEFQSYLIDVWGMDAYLPQVDGVTIEDFSAVFDANEAAFINSRHAVITSLDDQVIQQFIHAGLLGPVYTYLNMSTNPKYTLADWQRAVNEVDSALSVIPNANMWIRNDSTHVYIGDSLLIEAGGVSLADWLNDFRDGSDTWITVKDEISIQ